MQHEHGLHVHEFGDLTDGCQSTGSDFNPFMMVHGAPNDDTRHAGDYGNIRCDDEGKIHMALNDSRSTLVGYHNIIGRALVIHEKKDDLGKGGSPESVTSGDAGGNLACCTIVRAKPHGHWESHVHDHSRDHHHDPHDDHGDHKDHNHEDHMHGHGKHMHRGKKDKATLEVGHGDHSQHMNHAGHGKEEHHGHHDLADHRHH
ncbi:uncharacterized protein LOC135471406 isoform X1 [Liolophura sinensis]|uniref:uncharacterized protein LOC135471406 isoform X1 n=1 Tax=Liolophura sinensis TaxID=3198878 RepID=UPI0031595EF5